MITANQQAHTAIAAYLQGEQHRSAPWLYYKLVNVQYFPYDKVVIRASRTARPTRANRRTPAQNPAPSSYYLANIWSRPIARLQLFSGGLSPLPKGAVVTDWNADGTPRKNTNYGGHFYNMGGCMGCHGSQGQNRPGRPATSA